MMTGMFQIYNACSDTIRLHYARVEATYTLWCRRRLNEMKEESRQLEQCARLQDSHPDQPVSIAGFNR